MGSFKDLSLRSFVQLPSSKRTSTLPRSSKKLFHADERHPLPTSSSPRELFLLSRLISGRGRSRDIFFRVHLAHHSFIRSPNRSFAHYSIHGKFSVLFGSRNGQFSMSQVTVVFIIPRETRLRVICKPLSDTYIFLENVYCVWCNVSDWATSAEIQLGDSLIRTETSWNALGKVHTRTFQRTIRS